ncbi:unnamed protein product, partial [Discosporangium mesarthrocarpum]
EAPNKDTCKSPGGAKGRGLLTGGGPNSLSSSGHGSRCRFGAGSGTAGQGLVSSTSSASPKQVSAFASSWRGTTPASGMLQSTSGSVSSSVTHHVINSPAAPPGTGTSSSVGAMGSSSWVPSDEDTEDKKDGEWAAPELTPQPKPRSRPQGQRWPQPQPQPQPRVPVLEKRQPLVNLDFLKGIAKHHKTAAGRGADDASSLVRETRSSSSLSTTTDQERQQQGQGQGKDDLDQ